MSDRQRLQDELNRINELFQEKDLEMRKAGASIEQRQRMRDLLNAKKQSLTAELGDSLQKLNIGEPVPVSGGTISQGLDQSKLPDIAKQKGLGKEHMFSKLAGKIGKKAAGIVPLAGIGMAISDSPAASASELIKDPQVQRAALSEISGPIGDVIDIGGDVVEYGLDRYQLGKDLKAQREAEAKALENYKNSPAYKAKRENLEDEDMINQAHNSQKNPFSKLRKLFE